jgi:hypothetical protein
MLPTASQCERAAIARSFGRELNEMGWEFNELKPGIGAAIGHAFHAAVRYMLAVRKMDPERPAEFNETAKLVALCELQKQVKDGVEMDDVANTIAQAEEQLVEMLAIYVPHLNRLAAPIDIELKLSVSVRPGVRAQGKIDQRTADFIVRDHKTGTGQLKWFMPQLGLYSLLLKSKKERVDGVAADFLQRLKHKRPEAIVKTYDVVEAEKIAWSLVHRVADNYETFIQYQDPHVFNANPSALFCRQFCKAWKTPFCKAAD